MGRKRCKAAGRQWYDVHIMMDLPPQLPIQTDLLPYVQQLPARDLSQIDLVVMHCTELPDMAMAREYGERVLYDSGTGNSGHFYIDRDGSIHQYVSAGHIANHTRGYNPRSIGIEMVNIGRYPNWLDSRQQAMPEAYTEAQITSLIGLLLQLKAQLPNLQFIAGHEQLDTEQVPASDDATQRVFRKRDPGPHFPWSRILEVSSLQALPLDVMP
jgi:N-acetylmuramoyl-L-alanine amidase